MYDLLPEQYKNWTIKLYNEEHLCSAFSFDIISPEGAVQHVSMGGKTADVARSRAKEMVDMEIALTLDDM